MFHDKHPNLPPVFADAMDIRLKVFAGEQGCSAENELDDDDARSWQWVAYLSDPVACIRLVPPPHAPHHNGVVDENEQPYIKITRMAVMRVARGAGLARQMCDEALGWAAKNPDVIGNGWKGLVLVHAQVSVEKVWQRLGFKTDPRLGQWDEEGIQHIGMWRQLDMISDPSS